MPYQITGKRANAEISTPMTATLEKNTTIWETTESATTSMAATVA